MWFSKSCRDGVHKFQPRYDLSEPKIPWEQLAEISIGPSAVDRLRVKTYVRDVCVRCGEVIERDSEVIPMRKRA